MSKFPDKSFGIHSGSTIRRSWSHVICILLLLLFVVYFALCQWIEVDTALLGGKKSLLLEDNKMQINITKPVHSITMLLKDKITLSRGHTIHIIGKDMQIYPLPIKSFSILLQEGRNLLISSDNGVIGPGWITVYFEGVRGGSFPTRKFIENIDVDGREYKPKEFLDKVINKERSNLVFYQPLLVENVSNFLAFWIGQRLLIGVTSFLVVLLAAQVIIFFTLWKYGGPFDENWWHQKASLSVLNIIDIISENYATLLGFLGTALSIWVALEQSALDYSDFFQALSTIKLAVFTTVLGLLIRLMQGIRIFLFKNDRAENESMKQS